MKVNRSVLTIDGSDLTIEDVVGVARNGARVKLSRKAGSRE